MSPKVPHDHCKSLPTSAKFGFFSRAHEVAKLPDEVANFLVKHSRPLQTLKETLEMAMEKITESKSLEQRAQEERVSKILGLAPDEKWNPGTYKDDNTKADLEGMSLEELQARVANRGIRLSRQRVANHDELVEVLWASTKEGYKNGAQKYMDYIFHKYFKREWYHTWHGETQYSGIALMLYKTFNSFPLEKKIVASFNALRQLPGFDVKLKNKELVYAAISDDERSALVYATFYNQRAHLQPTFKVVTTRTRAEATETIACQWPPPRQIGLPDFNSVFRNHVKAVNPEHPCLKQGFNLQLQDADENINDRGIYKAFLDNMVTDITFNLIYSTQRKL